MDYEKRADELEGEVESMQRASDRLESSISEARDDWRRKQADPAVPGADEADDDHRDHDGDPEAQPPGR